MNKPAYGGSGLPTAYSEIMSERERQDNKFGVQNRSPVQWLVILGEEFGEACQAALHASGIDGSKGISHENYRKELIQVAAVAVAAIECLDKNDA